MGSVVGWQEITQFTYFRKLRFDLKPISVEITYGLERITMYLQEKENVLIFSGTKSSLMVMFAGRRKRALDL